MAELGKLAGDYMGVLWARVIDDLRDFNSRSSTSRATSSKAPAAAVKSVVADQLPRGTPRAASEDGTRLTNDATGHGMFVSIENVSSF